jgi:hypothetical protein
VLSRTRGHQRKHVRKMFELFSKCTSEILLLVTGIFSGDQNDSEWGSTQAFMDNRDKLFIHVID